jgi:hypothetical protein
MLNADSQSILQKPSILFIVFCACFSIWFMDLWRVWHFNDHPFKWDAANYYSYLPAYFNYNGSFEYNHNGNEGFLAQSPLGGHMPKATYGMAFLYSPFYFLGYKIALNQHNPLTGFSEPFATCVHWGSIFYGLLGLLFLRNLLVKFYSEKTSTLTLAIIFLGTSVFNYVLAHSEMSHGYLFMLFSAFLLTTYHWYQKPSILKTLLIGFLMGLITLIRPSEILMIFFFIFWLTDQPFSFKGRFFFLLTKWYHLLLIALVAFLMWVPQMIFWKHMTGQYLYFSYPGERFYWDDPQIINILFSYRKGWFVYTPLIILAFIGLFFMKEKFKSLRNTITVIILLNIYILSCWWDWFFGGCFAARGFTHHHSYLAFPIAALVSFLFECEWKFSYKPIVQFAFYIVIFSGICLNIGQTYQYNQNIIHYMSMTKKAYWHVFGKYKLSGKAEADYWRYLSEPNYGKLISGEDRDQ